MKKALTILGIVVAVLLLFKFVLGLVFNVIGGIFGLVIAIVGLVIPLAILALVVFGCYKAFKFFTS